MVATKVWRNTSKLRKNKEIKREIKQHQQDNWDKYISRIENDIHGRQHIAYKVMKHLNSTKKDVASINVISSNDWLKYFKQLWTKQTDHEEENITETPYTAAK